VASYQTAAATEANVVTGDDRGSTRGTQQQLFRVNDLGAYGDVTVYYTGQRLPEAHPGQTPPTEAARDPRPRFVGPILDALERDGCDWWVVVLANGPVFDLPDFSIDLDAAGPSRWERRLLLVRTDPKPDDESWSPLVFRYRDADAPEVVVRPLVRLFPPPPLTRGSRCP